MKTTFALLVLLLAASTLPAQQRRGAQRPNTTGVQSVQEDVTQYVDPFIGTQGGGNTFPGAAWPFGMVKLGPDCGKLDTNSGYSPGDTVRGFSHVHVSGTGGGPKYGNILIYPFAGDVPVAGYGSPAGKEVAKTGYYSVELTATDILAELSCTPKTGMHRYTFRKGGHSGILIDAGSFLGSKSCCFEEQELVGSEVEVLSDREISGYSRVRGGWNTGGPYTVYFYAIFDTPSNSFGTWKSGKVHLTNKSEFDSGAPTGAWFGYDCKPGQVIGVKVGISFISAGKARTNCILEAGSLNFEQAMSRARTQWTLYLNRIRIDSPSKTEKIKFYTALYHTMMMPADRTGENPGWTGKEPYYDDYYCIWDTYRTSHPLFTLFIPEIQTDITRSLIDIYEHEGYMPDARAGNSNGRTQGGSNCDMLVAEAILKELPGIDYEKGYQAMVKNAEVPPGGDERLVGRGGLKDYNTIGYVSTDFERAGSRTVEYAANDWAIALSAQKLGKADGYRLYAGRSCNWENLWKPEEHSGAKGFIMPRKASGDWDEGYRDKLWSWYTETPPRELGLIPYNRIPANYLSKDPFTPLSGGSWMDFFYESHSWEYSFYVPHDMKRLIEKCGGTDAFISRLDTFFSLNYFQMSNEPGFLTPCLYNYAGRPDKTAETVTRLLKVHYTDRPDGLPGNDDSGAMSSWYAFQAMGFFPVAGQDVYLIGTPRFSRTSINTGGGKSLIILAENLSEKNIYVISAALNDKPLDQNWFRHADIRNGGTLQLVMSDKPSGWGTKNLPPSRSDSR
jgi:predicted alpha-1,2-mannosidase